MRYVEELAMDICNYVHHGECFYDEEDFKDLQELVQAFVDECKNEFKSNQEELNV